MCSFIFICFTVKLQSGQVFLVFRVLITYFVLPIETGWKPEKEIFFDFIISLIFVTLG